MKKSLKRGLTLLVITLLLASMGSIPVMAQDHRDLSGLLVEGDYEYRDIDGGVSISKYLGSGGAVTIPTTLGGKPVLDIGVRAFEQNDSLTAVTIPTGVIRIYNSAFSACKNLTQVVLPDTLTSIAELAFTNCTSLTDITIPEGVTTIELGAFESCTNLTQVTLPTSLSSIGSDAFGNCQRLTDINLPDSLHVIHPSTFANCTSLTGIILPDTLTDIEMYAFSGCTSLTAITIPESAIFIGKEAFSGCVNLASIQFNAAFTTIEEATQTIPTTTTIIGYIPSTAKNYAAKYGNPFELLNPEGWNFYNYQTHIQNIGWQDYATDGELSGTEGRSLRLEGIKINSYHDNLGVEYATHIQNIGWQDYVANGELSGTTNQSLRLEAIKINLTGSDSAKYDIQYRVHVQNIGWMDWSKNGEVAGTTDLGYRLEAIEIKIVKITADLTAYNAALATVNPADYSAVSWADYQTIVAANSMTGDNLQTEVDAATAAIMAAQDDLILSPDYIIVHAQIDSGSFAVQTVGDNIISQATALISKAGFDATNYVVTFTRVDNGIAQIDANGLIASIGDGTAIVTFTLTPVDGSTAATTAEVVLALS